MTDLPVRLQTIRAELEAATPGPWEHRSHGTGIRGGGAYDFIVHPVVGIIAERSPSGTAADATFIASAPDTVAKLLAAVEGVARLAEKWEARGEHDMAYSKTIPDEDIAMSLLTSGAEMVENARHIRRALTDALGDER